VRIQPKYAFRLSLFFPRLLFYLALYFFLSSCTLQENVIEQSPAEFPIYLDDAPTQSLLTAIDHHLNYLRNLPAEEEMQIGKHVLSPAELAESLSFFRSVVEQNPDPLALGQLIRRHFHVFEAAGRNEEGDVLVTGYYEPLFKGSLSRIPPFIYPLYRIPDSLVSSRNRGSGTKEIGRLEQDGTIIPYWTRQEIETGDLAKGHELVYLRDPLDAYLLHVQGSGRILLQDGSSRAIGFASSNGLDYHSLGKLFVDKKIMPREEVNIPSIRNYFRNNPEQITGMLHHNPRYIFFKWGDERGPRGSLGTILTPGRSIAIDQSVLPVGALGYLVSNKPVLNSTGEIDHWRLFGRFVVPQDSGSAIKGAGRVDLFWGSGHYAETAASHMNESGKLFFLVKKNFELAGKIR